MLRHPNTAPRPERAPPKKRGSYNCGRCGLPKKGHVCPNVDPAATPDPSSAGGIGGGFATPIPPRSDLRLRRALSFDDEGEEEAVEEEEEEEVDEVVEGSDPLTASCLAQILRRLSPKELMGAAAVCKGWRDLVKRVWISVEEVKLKLSPTSQIGFVGTVLNKCVGLTKLTLTMERLWRFTEPI